MATLFLFLSLRKFSDLKIFPQTFSLPFIITFRWKIVFDNIWFPLS